MCTMVSIIRLWDPILLCVYTNIASLAREAYWAPMEQRETSSFVVGIIPANMPEEIYIVYAASGRCLDDRSNAQV